MNGNTPTVEYKAVETAIKRLEGRVQHVIHDPQVRRAVGELKADVKKAAQSK